MLSLFGLVNSSLQPLTGRFSDRTGQRKLLVLVGLVLIAAASFSYSLAETYWHLVEQDRSAWSFEVDLRPDVADIS